MNPDVRPLTSVEVDSIAEGRFDGSPVVRPINVMLLEAKLSGHSYMIEHLQKQLADAKHALEQCEQDRQALAKERDGAEREVRYLKHIVELSNISDVVWVGRPTDGDQSMARAGRPTPPPA